MRDEPAHLQSKNEVVACRFPPVSESLLRRQFIETVIKLHGIKLPGAELQPFRLGQFLGVIEPAPVLIMPAAATNLVLYRHIASPRFLATTLLYYHPDLVSSLRNEIAPEFRPSQ